MTPARPGPARLRVRQHIYNDLLFAVNGTVQAVPPDWDMPDPRWDDQPFTITLDLAEGENTLTVAALRLARVVIGGLLLETLDADLEVRPPLADCPVDRRTLEDAFLSVTLPRDAFRGVFGCTHGRTGASSVIHPETEGTAGRAWLLTGAGSLNRNMGTASLAVSGCRPSPVVFSVADDRGSVTTSRQRQGLPQGEGSANFIVTRTPDCMLSALQDHAPFTLTKQVHVFRATLKERAVVFFTAPTTSRSSSSTGPDPTSPPDSETCNLEPGPCLLAPGTRNPKPFLRIFP